MNYLEQIKQSAFLDELSKIAAVQSASLIHKSPSINVINLNGPRTTWIPKAPKTVPPSASISGVKSVGIPSSGVKLAMLKKIARGHLQPLDPVQARAKYNSDQPQEMRSMSMPQKAPAAPAQPVADTTRIAMRPDSTKAF